MQRFSDSATARASLTIIVPVLNEAQQIERLLVSLASLAKVNGAVQLLVVDGGSRDDTVARIKQQGLATVLEFGQASRALQMNAAARQATADILLFLHADVRLPADAIQVVRQALTHQQCVGGCFSFGFPLDVPFPYRVYAWGVRLRTRLFTSATGDQAIFVRRSVFGQIDGFRPQPLLEDIAFFNAMKQHGRVAILPQRVIISPRRWQQFGLVKTGLLMYALRLGGWLGIAPATLKRFFLDVR